VSQESEYTLAGFVQTVIASSEEWQQWEQVASAAAPGTRPVLPSRPYDRFYHEQLPASPDFKLNQELRSRFVGGVRRLLVSGEWEAWGRTGATSIRQRLEAVDVEQATIDFVRNRIGLYQHVRLRRPRPVSNKEVLERFIETVCRAAGQPGKKLSKKVVEDLAQALCRDNFTSAAFLAAWEDAPIAPGWKEPGRR
jgi:hypothetical protein